MEGRTHSAGQAVSEAGITVQQQYMDEEFDLPSVVFKVRSERDDPVEVRFAVPDIEARKVGFHPEFRSDAWDIEDEQLVFETTVRPDAEVTTLYALDTDDESVFERAMESVYIDQVQSSGKGPSLDLDLDEPVEDSTSGDSDESVDASSSDADEPTAVAEPGGSPVTPHGVRPASDGGDVVGTPAAVDAETDTPGPEVGLPPDTEGPAEAVAVDASGDDVPPESARNSTQESEDDSGASDAEADSGASDGSERQTGRAGLDDQSTETLVDELLDRVEEGDLSPAHRERLAGLASTHGGADEVRIDSLQSRVSDIEAFTDPIEQLLDRHGPPAAAFDAVEERLAAVEALDERVRELEQRVETVDDHDDAIDRLDEQVEDVDERVASLDEEFDATTEQLATDMEGIESELTAVREQLETVETTVETVREEASDAGERADAVDAELTAVEDRLDELGTQLDDLGGDWEQIEDDITALQEWRNNLASTFDAFGN